MGLLESSRPAEARVLAFREHFTSHMIANKPERAPADLFLRIAESLLAANQRLYQARRCEPGATQGGMAVCQLSV
ncbi:hypothetical protein CTA1_2305 [Colletotrichum tanaceti]|uniref:Uncharacterized protein n=1 Tax=Colletotrichum tanaceti TaxID=1306861 RepID=A0A4U6X4E1_9PEZI|nr:hypothetical protein CTA1_2305 [Colletotrichum tanaceti]